jgi:hypothetical protein
MKHKQTKQEREDRALEAIICGVLRGFGDKEWKKVFANVDEIERIKRLKAKPRDIY